MLPLPQLLPLLLLGMASAAKRGPGGGGGSKLDQNVPNMAQTVEPSELIKEYGYPSEVHTVQTEDGYLLRVDRIPNPGMPVVLVGHGMHVSASIYMLNGAESLAFALYDAGLDVWLLSFRGNGFSLSHVNLTTRDPDFWRFSWHEMGYYDIPAVTDYALNATGQPSLFYVAQAMGSTSFLVMASLRPEYSLKLSAALLMAPVAFTAHHKLWFADVFGPVINDTVATALKTGVERTQVIGPEMQTFLVRLACQCTPSAMLSAARPCSNPVVPIAQRGFITPMPSRTLMDCLFICYERSCSSYERSSS